MLSGKLNERARVDLEAVEMRFSDGGRELPVRLHENE